MLLSCIRMFLCVPVSHRQWQRNLEVSFQEQRYARRLALYSKINNYSAKEVMERITNAFNWLRGAPAEQTDGRTGEHLCICDSYTYHTYKCIHTIGKKTIKYGF